MTSTRRLLTRRVSATMAGSVIMLAGVGLTALAPSAYAGTVTPTVHCVLPAGQGEATGPMDMTVTLTPANAAPGTPVHAVVKTGAGPANSTIGASNVSVTPSLQLTMSGAATGVVTVQGPTFKVNLTSGQPVPIPQYEGDFFLPATGQGAINFTPLRTSTVTDYFGSHTTNCDVTAGGGVVSSVNVQGPGSGQPTLTAPTGTLRPGTTVAFSGLGFAANATATPSLCDANGGNCLTTRFTASTLAVSAQGVLTGTATLAASGIPNGSYVAKVSTATAEATSPVTVQAYVPAGPRELTAGPNRGPVGTTVNLSGKNYNANRSITLQALDASGANVGNYVTGPRSSPEGVWTGSFTITEPLTASIRAMEGSNANNGTTVAFTIANDPPTLAAAASTTHAGGTVALTGANWAPGSTLTASLCAADGTGCATNKISASTLAVSPTGALTGGVTIAGNVGEGSYKVSVTDGSNTAAAAVTVQKRWIELNKSSGPTGTWVTVSGHNYGILAWIKLVGVDAQGKATNDISYAAADWPGNWCTVMQINDSRTVAVVASETFSPSKLASAPFTVTP
ncbi:hypothetical protein [Streptomyces sp. SID3343]|uniref:hypothetical protein n=1 Tax=Streptomyces sp. SID3343 TaxID=2690260 RepID=UPI00136A956B|nr:hypothetical protein [Streptomyces sp. SID3343]MYW02114.1 hypothetical protein [Streptomyces sp. SID3343]